MPTLDLETTNVDKRYVRRIPFGKLEAALPVALAWLSAGRLCSVDQRRKQDLEVLMTSVWRTQERGQVCPSLWRLRMRSRLTRSA